MTTCLTFVVPSSETGLNASQLRLFDADRPRSLRSHVETLLNQGVPADFEQESIPVRDVWAALMATPCK